MDWNDIVYDIPLPKKERKAALAEDKDGSLEKRPTDNPESTTTPVPAGKRRILNGVKGSVRKGEMVAILGASGAGKTTLLNILSARLDSTGDLQGKVLFNGKARDSRSWKRTVGFVEQDDLLMDFLSVRETLEFAARLRLPDRLFNKTQRQERVEEVIDTLRLEKCQSTRIGNTESRGVSGGERKRVAIGCELVSDVQLLMLDEPTSGLDAFQAVNVVSNLKEIAQKKNLACLATIHQPSWRSFCLFDRVILLARGGVFYSGPPRDALAYFDSLGMPTPEGSNPADHFISIAENLDRTDESERRIMSLLTSWQEHEKAHKDGGPVTTTSTVETQEEDASKTPSSEKAVAATAPSAADSIEDEELLKAYRQYPTSWMSEFGVLCERKYLQIARNRVMLIGTLGQTVVLCIILGFAFFRLGTQQSDVLARIGILFFVPINSSFAVIFPLVSLFPVQRALMKKERSSGLYRTSSFYLSQIVVEIPSQCLQRALFYVILYFMVGLRLSASAFFIWMGINFVQVFTAVGQGLGIGCISPSLDIATILAPLINVIMLLFGGQLLPVPPPWFIWLRYISPIFYAYAALSLNEYRGLQFQCDGSSSTSQCFQTGQSVVDSYHLGTFTIAENVGFLFAITFAWLAFGYVALRILGHPRFRYI